MQIINRKDAKTAGLSQYFTGEQCKNGHLTYRYVTSGSCADCLAEAQGRARNTTSAPRLPHVRLEKRGALALLVETKVRAYPADVGLIRDTAVAMCRGRFPILDAGDLMDTRGPTDGDAGTYMYRIKVHPDDAQMIQDTARALLRTHVVDLAPQFATMAQKRERMINDATSEPPEWKP